MYIGLNRKHADGIPRGLATRENQARRSGHQQDSRNVSLYEGCVYSPCHSVSTSPASAPRSREPVKVEEEDLEPQTDANHNSPSKHEMSVPLLGSETLSAHFLPPVLDARPSPCPKFTVRRKSVMTLSKSGLVKPQTWKASSTPMLFDHLPRWKALSVLPSSQSTLFARR